MKNKSTIIVFAVIAIAAGLFFFKGGFIAGRMILKAGKPMHFGTYTVQIDKVEGNKLYGIKVSSKNRRFSAEKGDYAYLPEKNAIKFNLINGAADDYDPQDPKGYHTLTFKQFYITIRLKPSAGQENPLF